MKHTDLITLALTSQELTATLQEDNQLEITGSALGTETGLYHTAKVSPEELPTYYKNVGHNTTDLSLVDYDTMQELIEFFPSLELYFNH